jgi:RimJ/RimL family protein N-acetyltransferase
VSLYSFNNSLVRLEVANKDNVDLLIQWTLDPKAQGPYKFVPSLTAAELRHQFLHDPNRQYFMILRASDGTPLGRLYWRAWRFVPGIESIDWEINIFLADPQERGKGYGTSAQHLAAKQLEGRLDTRSIFAFTLTSNSAERGALLKAGFCERGELPNGRYPVYLPEHPCVLFVWPSKESA